MSRAITVYDATSGVVLYSCDVEQDAELRLMPGEAWTNGHVDGSTHWIRPETGKANLRRPMTIKASANALSRVPEGAVVVQGGEQFEVSGGALVYEPDLGLEQEVRLEVLHPQYLPASVAVPIRAEQAAPIAGATKRQLRQDYAALRRAAFPAEGEQIGALMKAVQALLAGEAVPADALAVIAEIDAVKAANPKPGRKSA